MSTSAGDDSEVKYRINTIDTWINIGSLNVRSAVNKTGIIHQLIEKNGFDILCISETFFTNLTEKEAKDKIAPTGFTPFHRPRDIVKSEKSRGGGVSAICHTSLPVEDLTESLDIDCRPSQTEAEIQVLRVGLKPLDTMVINCYRPPDGDKDTFIEELTALINNMQNERNVVIIGDINMSIRGKPQINDELRTLLCEDNRYVQLVVGQTHEKGGLLDVLAVKDQTLVKHTTNVRLKNSVFDQNMVTAQLYGRRLRKK